jgi:hypothetical protein
MAAQIHARVFSLADLTINICTVDRPAYLRAAIQSLIEHTPKGPTLQLVLNEASSETWPAISDLVDAWPGPTKVIEVESRLPVDQSHQRALDSCGTELINFMGDDDIVLGNRFDEAIDTFNSHPTMGVLGSWVQRIGGSPEGPRFLGRMDIGPVSVDDWQQMRAESQPVQFCFPVSIYSTNAAREAGGFQPRFGPAIDAGLSALVARQHPALAQTSRLFGFRIHDGSDSAQNFKVQFHHWHYVTACVVALDNGEAEPTYEQWETNRLDQPAWKNFAFDQNIKSRHAFRRAGAALLDRRLIDFAKYGSQSLAYSPRMFTKKAVEQLGHRQPT